MSSRKMIQAAYREGYAVGSFNVYNLESIQAAIMAAEAERSPVMIQAWAGIFAYQEVDPVTLAALARSLAWRASVPVCLHLDHGPDVEMVEQACLAGFTSVMIDASALPIAENVAVTRRAVETARRFDVPVEAELGHVGGAEEALGDGDSEAALTDPETAKAFVSQAGCDYLAVAIGTAHGRYQSQPHLDIPRLKAIRAAVDVPLVLHGSSYTPDDQVAATIPLGMAKINVATELSDVWLEAAKRAAAGTEQRYPSQILAPARDAVAERIRAKIRLFGSSGKAPRA
ncbi:MAG: class II fructose-bisphosphate aldolase [Bacillota bacterium]